MSNWKKLLLALAAPFLLFGLFELALRLARFEFVQSAAPILVWNPVDDARMEQGEGLHQTDPAQLWKPRPGAEIEWGEGERVNAAGWRGPIVKRKKPEGVLRVATLGDSSTFGMLVPYGDCYSAQLEGLLREEGKDAQVLDFGVIGYTVRQGLERYRALVRLYHPDVVVLAFGAVNDHFGKIGIVDRDKIARSRGARGFLVRFLPKLRTTQFLAWLRYRRLGGEKGLRLARADAVKREQELGETSGRIDWKGERRVPLDDFDRALAELVHEIEADGAKPVLVAMPRQPIAEDKRPVLALYSEKVREVAERERVALLDARSRFREELAQGRSVEELFAGDWWHPTRAGHAIIARGLLPLVDGSAPAGE